jgi:hypothetical protein
MDELCITIPCTPAKGPDANPPIYVFDGLDKTGAAICHWECPHCRMVFRRRKPCVSHMGGVPNKPASCSVLAAQDEQRRAKVA